MLQAAKENLFKYKGFHISTYDLTDFSAAETLQARKVAQYVKVLKENLPTKNILPDRALSKLKGKDSSRHERAKGVHHY